MHSEVFDPVSHFQQDDRHHCFLIFKKVGDDSIPTATILHHLAVAPTRIGNPTPHDGLWHLTANQPIGGHQITVDLPLDLFTQGVAVQTFVPNRIQGEVGNKPDLEQLIPEISDANLEDLELIKTRNAMWIPNQYAVLLLDDDLSPVSTWVRVYGAILQNGHLDACCPLVQFLQVQLLGNSVSNTHPFVGLTQTFTSESLIRHRNAALSHMTTMVALSAPHAPAPMQGMSAIDFQALIAALRHGQIPQALAAPGTAGTTVKKRWSVNLQTLLKLTHCTSAMELAPVWSVIAKGPKKEERNIIQAAFDDLARNPGASTTASLTVTKELHNTVVNLMFWSGDIVRLDEGLHPFRTVNTSTAKTSMDQSNLQTYDLLASNGNLDLENIRMFQHIFKSDWPTSYMQLDTTLKWYHHLSVLLLKPTHPYAAAYSIFLNIWKSISVQLAELFATKPSMPAQFLRSIQLCTAVYWQSVNALNAMEARVLPPPDFAELLSSVRIQSWIPPLLPGAPLASAYSGTPTVAPNPSPSLGPAPAAAPPPAPAPAPVT